MFIIRRHSDNATFRVQPDGRPVPPVLVGTTATIVCGGQPFAEVTPEAPGPQRFESEAHGSCVVFGIEPECVDRVLQRLNPQSPGGRSLARALMVIQSLCSNEPRFDGTLASLHADPPIRLEKHGADSGSWQHQSVEQLER